MKKMMVYTLFIGWLVMTVAINACASESINTNKPIDILYVDLNDNNAVDEHELLLVMEANDYQKVFNINIKQLPLKRMLRGQMEGCEYIALNHHDFVEMDTNNDGALTIADGNALYKIELAKVTGIIKGTYVSTKASKQHIGKFKVIVLHIKQAKEFLLEPGHTAHFHEGHTVQIKSTANHPHVGL